MGIQQRAVSRTQWLRRLASKRRSKTAFVLSGGGPYGAMQVGALRALFEAGISPDLIVGTSAGSLNGAFLARDPSPEGVTRLEWIWRNLTDEDLFPGARYRASWARFLMRGNRVFDNAGMRNLIESRLGVATFEEMQIPFTVVATDQLTGGETHFTSGSIVEPLLASTAMPAIFPPVRIDGRDYMDGGVSNQVPILPAIEAGADVVYVLDASAGHQQPRPLVRPIDHLLHAFQLSRAQRLDLEMSMYESRARIEIIPVPVLEFTVPFTSLAHTATLIERGYAAAHEVLRGMEEPAEVTPLAGIPAAEPAI